MTAPDPKPAYCFHWGALVATPGALEALKTAQVSAAELLARHAAGDWGVVDADDQKANNTALQTGGRLMSAYVLPTGEKVWLITEAEDDQGRRASTCFLLADEY